MISLDDLLLLLTEGALIGLGSVLVYVSMRAYRRGKSKPLLVMSIGFVVILLGSLIEEFSLEVLGYHMVQAHILENLIVAVGMLVLVYSIYGVRG